MFDVVKKKWLTFNRTSLRFEQNGCDTHSIIQFYLELKLKGICWTEYLNSLIHKKFQIVVALFMLYDYCKAYVTMTDEK